MRAACFVRMATLLAAGVFLGILSGGCFGVCDNWIWYEVRGRIVDASTGLGLERAAIAISLLRSGENIQIWGNFTEATTTDGGSFETAITIEHAGGLCGGIWGSLPSLEFGEPPDEVRMTVQIGDRRGSGRAFIDPESIMGLHYLAREIDLPTIEIQFTDQ